MMIFESSDLCNMTYPGQDMDVCHSYEMEIETSDDEDTERFKQILAISATAIVGSARGCTTGDVERPIIPDYRFSFARSPLPCRFLFRFDEVELKMIVRHIHAPHWHWTRQRDKFPFMEGLIILLRRLVFPTRWGDVV